MGTLKRYRTALSRYHKSGGYGIHSPFAFAFVREVLCERSSYYAYGEIETFAHDTIGSRRFRPFSRERGNVPMKEAKMLFRIANYFQPERVLVVGEASLIKHAISLVNSKMEVETCAADAAIAELRDGDNASNFVVVNEVPASMDAATLASGLMAITRHDEAVVVLRGLDHDKVVSDTLEQMRALMQYGMIFTNHKTAVIVLNSKLPRQDFSLWF